MEEELTLKRISVKDGITLFKPEEGRTIIPPPAPGHGNWCGAPSAIYDPVSSKYYLYFRVRRPRDAQPEKLARGGECFIAESDDGCEFNPIWHLEKSQVPTSSFERACLHKTLDEKWRIYLSFVDDATKQWNIVMMEADHPSQFDINTRVPIKPVFPPELSEWQKNIIGLKDPYLVLIGKRYHMIVSCAVRANQTAGESALLTSDDGINFTMKGVILRPNPESWDSWCTRISCLVWKPRSVVALYDGSDDVEKNYEEQTAVAEGPDLHSLIRTSASLKGPLLVSQEEEKFGSLRYVDALQFPRKTMFYYEYGTDDGSHELRLNIVHHD